MGMDILAIIFGIAAIGLGGYFFVKEVFGKNDPEDELSAKETDKKDKQ